MSEINNIRQARLNSRAETAGLVSELRSAASALRQERAAYQREKAERDKERAAERRRGEHGPQLQAVQRRIDAGQTTWDDVVAGRDDHPSAQRVREQIETNLNTLSDHLADDPEFVEEADAVRANSNRIDDEMHRR